MATRCRKACSSPGFSTVGCMPTYPSCSGFGLMRWAPRPLNPKLRVIKEGSLVVVDGDEGKVYL